MSKLYWVSATISDSGGSANAVVISGVVTEGVSILEEEETANIEDNQDINIAYAGGFTMETRNDTFDGGSNPILNDSRVNTDGATKCRLVLTAENATTATIDAVYLNGRKGVISTGEVGVKLNCKRSDSTDPISYA